MNTPPRSRSLPTMAEPASQAFSSEPSEPPALPDDHAWTVLSHLVRPQGRKGEVLGELLTDFPDRFLEFPHVHLARPGFTGAPEQAKAAEIVSCWLPTGRSQGRVVLGFQAVTSINDAEQLCGLDVLVLSSDRMPLEDGSSYIDDLIGCQVIDLRRVRQGQDSFAEEKWVIGVVQDVSFSTDPEGRKLEEMAPLLMVVTRGGYEVVIPFAADFLVNQDLQKRQIILRIPDGLLEIYGVPQTDLTRVPVESGDER